MSFFFIFVWAITLTSCFIYRAPEHLVEDVAGEGEVRAVFDLSDRRGNKADVVAGCLVNVGSLDGSEKFRLMRDGTCVHRRPHPGHRLLRHTLSPCLHSASPLTPRLRICQPRVL